MIKQIIKNELKSLLGHEASDAEYLSAISYLSDGDGFIKTLADVGLALYDWREDNTKECASCGEYFLIETMEQDEDRNYFCSEECQSEFEKEKEYARQAREEEQSRWNER